MPMQSFMSVKVNMHYVLLQPAPRYQEKTSWLPASAMLSLAILQEPNLANQSNKHAMGN